MDRLARKVGRRLRDQNLRGRTIQIKIRWSDFTTLTRQVTLPQAINDDQTIIRESRGLLQSTWEEGRAVRLVGVGVSNLDTRAQQLLLWSPEVKKDLKLQETIDNLQKKFGKEIISRGVER
jgi:DNA polymerase-4